MKRYKFGAVVAVDDDPEGRWVLWSDVEKVIERIRDLPFDVSKSEIESILDEIDPPKNILKCGALGHQIDGVCPCCGLLLHTFRGPNTWMLP